MSKNAACTHAITIADLCMWSHQHQVPHRLAWAIFHTYSHLHTHTSTHTHACTRTRTKTHTHYLHIHKNTYTHAFTHELADMHSHIHLHTQALTHGVSRTYTRGLAPSHILTPSRSHTWTYSQSHTHKGERRWPRDSERGSHFWLASKGLGPISSDTKLKATSHSRIAPDSSASDTTLVLKSGVRDALV